MHKTQTRREIIIFANISNFVNFSFKKKVKKEISDLEYLGGIEHFRNLNIDQLKKLIDEGLVDLNDKQNDAPTVSEFYEFMQTYPFVRAHGYIVEDRRNDSRISLEGLETLEILIPNETIKEQFEKDFTDLCETADDFKTGKVYYSWWD